MASASGVGLTAAPVQSYGDGEVCIWIHDEDISPGQVFVLALYPDLRYDASFDRGDTPCFQSCCVAISCVNDSGRVYLFDQHGHLFDGSRQCLVGGKWNLIALDLFPAVGRALVEVRLEGAAGLSGGGWVQFLGIRDSPVEELDVTDRVRTARGTHSAFLYSRGNTLPQVSTPHGAHFLTPLTEARDKHWLYGWHRDGGPNPYLQGFAFNHTPSPWIADRCAFQVMPWQGKRAVDPEQRSRHFSHDDELDRPHRYRVAMEGGITADMVATDHAGAFRFTFDQEGPHGVVLDQPSWGKLDCQQLPDGRVAFTASIGPEFAWRKNRLGTTPPAYVYGETSVPATVHRAWERRSPVDGLSIRGRRLSKSFLGKLAVPLPRPQATILECSADVVEVRAAMSFISIDQARRSWHMEIEGRAFEDLVTDAHDQWADLLERLEIDGGTLDQRTTAWSNLARLYSWPNAHHENLGTATEPHWAYASPYRRNNLPTHTHTGWDVVDGRMYVNNGYWDTFRTCWPLYSLLTPNQATDLLDGILQQYRDGGWMARWAAPGPVDCMPGTSSDVIFANASLAGTLEDELTAYDSALRNATAPSEDPAVGRKGIDHGRFVGWIDTDTQEGLAWSVDSAMEDASIGLWSGRLAERARTDDADPALAARLGEFEANAAWFANRSLSHQAMFDARVGFYQGRKPDGSFRFGPDEFDPAVWGRDYTETSAWGQAFHAPHDGVGLAALFGGEEALAAKIDELLVTPAITRPSMYGGYDYNTQEMNEAQADGIGQLAISNQPAHHIPFMYLFAGQPHKTQWLTRELLDKKFVGSEIGQGYPGDEDNGEMSGYWLCLAMGLFPLFPGSGEWAITAPLFERMAFRRDDGTTLEVRATGVEHRYIQSVRLNGIDWREVVISADRMKGDVLLEFQLGPEPSSWGRQSRPWSASTAGDHATWQPDRTLEARIDGDAHLIDDEGERKVELAAGEIVELAWDQAFVPHVLTLTSDIQKTLPLRVETRSAEGWAQVAIEPRLPRWAGQTMAYLLPAREIDGVRLVAVADCGLNQVEVY